MTQKLHYETLLETCFEKLFWNFYRNHKGICDESEVLDMTYEIIDTNIPQTEQEMRIFIQEDETLSNSNTPLAFQAEDPNDQLAVSQSELIYRLTKDIQNRLENYTSICTACDGIGIRMKLVNKNDTPLARGLNLKSQYYCDPCYQQLNTE